MNKMKQARLLIKMNLSCLNGYDKSVEICTYCANDFFSMPVIAKSWGGWRGANLILRSIQLGRGSPKFIIPFVFKCLDI